MHNGAVILLHSTSQTNAEILDELLTRLKEQGYSFAGLDNLFAQNPAR
jgi:peptidoglycan-N-acetylmuramic acid deacetylase